MSRAKLKKELTKMSREQLEQIILDAYDARKETKEYFEFFLNPDVKKLLEDFQKAVVKEFQRSKWGDCMARVTKVKRMIKDFVGLNPGIEAVLDMYFSTLAIMGLAARRYYLSQPQKNLACNITKEIIKIGDTHEIMSDIMVRFSDFFKNPSFSQSFKGTIYDVLEEMETPGLA